MASKKDKKIKMKSTESHEFFYTTKNKTSTPERLELRKYDRSLRRHVIFKESK